jgi:hypothetical protein
MISVMCACGKRLKTEDRHAGRRTKCPNCGADATFPEPEPAAEPFARAESPAAPRADAPKAPIADLLGEVLAGDTAAVSRASMASPSDFPGPATLSEAARRRSFRLSPSEPWYYDALKIFAFLCVALAAVPFLISLLMMVYALVSGPLATVVVVLPFLVGTFAATLFVMLMVSPILLAVDIARNIRQLRRLADRDAAASA